MQSLHTRILMGCNRYHSVKSLKYAMGNVSSNLLRFFNFFFLLDHLDGKGVDMAHVFTQTGDVAK